MTTMSKEQSLIEYRGSVAMTVTLVSFGMLFATFFLGYFLVRFNTAVWPPAELLFLPQSTPFFSSCVIILSSVMYEVFKKYDSKKYLWLSFIMGLGFVFLQIKLWSELKEVGILVANGMIPSMVYSFSWLHVAHMTLALIGLTWVGLKSKPSLLLVTNIGKFWHFLSVVWILIYCMFFIL